MITRAYYIESLEDKAIQLLKTPGRDKARKLTLTLTSKDNTDKEKTDKRNTDISVDVTISATTLLEKDLVRVEGVTDDISGKRANIIAQLYIDSRTPSGYAEVTLFS